MIYIFISEFNVRGIHPVGGKIDQSVICDCGPAIGKLRKELEVHVAWEDDMWKPDSDSFIAAKQKIEDQVCTKNLKILCCKILGISYIFNTILNLLSLKCLNIFS